MSLSKKSFLAVIPLLSLMAMAPSQMDKKLPSRAIANIDRGIALEQEEYFPKYEAKSQRIERKALYIDQSVTSSELLEKSNSLCDRISKFREEFKIDEVEPEKVKSQNQSLEDLILKVVLVEEDLKVVEKNPIKDKESEIVLVKESILEFKKIIESLLVDQVKNEQIVLKHNTDQQEVVIENEPKEGSADPVVTQAPSSEAPAKEEKKEETKKDDCTILTEQNKVLSGQVEGLIVDNKKILESMLSLIQVMLGQQQYQAQQAYLPYLSGPQMVHQLQMPMMQQINNQGQWAFIPEGYQMVPQGQSLSSQLGAQSYYQNSQSNMFNLAPQAYMMPNYSAPAYNYPIGDFGMTAHQVFNFNQV